MKTTTRVAALSLVLAAGLIMPGCYKSEADSQKARADAAEQELTAVKAELTKLKSDAQAASVKTQQTEAQLRAIGSGAVLVTYGADGQPLGTDTIRFDGQKFVRHGERRRTNGTIQFDNGKLADGPIAMNRESGSKWFEGAIRNSRPEGDWIWYSKDGKVSTRESWKDGKLVDTFKGATAKDGKVTWTKMAKADRDAWTRSTANTFVNLPELIRDTGSTATADATPASTSSAAPTKATPASTKSTKPAAKPASSTKKTSTR